MQVQGQRQLYIKKIPLQNYVRILQHYTLFDSQFPPIVSTVSQAYLIAMPERNLHLKTRGQFDRQEKIRL